MYAMFTRTIKIKTQINRVNPYTLCLHKSHSMSSSTAFERFRCSAISANRSETDDFCCLSRLTPCRLTESKSFNVTGLIRSGEICKLEIQMNCKWISESHWPIWWVIFGIGRLEIHALHIVTINRTDRVYVQRCQCVYVKRWEMCRNKMGRRQDTQQQGQETWQEAKRARTKMMERKNGSNRQNGENTKQLHEMHRKKTRLDVFHGFSAVFCATIYLVFESFSIRAVHKRDTHTSITIIWIPIHWAYACKHIRFFVVVVARVICSALVTLLCSAAHGTFAIGNLLYGYSGDDCVAISFVLPRRVSRERPYGRVYASVWQCSCFGEAMTDVQRTYSTNVKRYKRKRHNAGRVSHTIELLVFVSFLLLVSN